MTNMMRVKARGTSQACQGGGLAPITVCTPGVKMQKHNISVSIINEQIDNRLGF
jgi:hypothetical protein